MNFGRFRAAARWISAAFGMLLVGIAWAALHAWFGVLVLIGITD